MIDKFEGRFRFLSNFYPSKITLQGITYPTNEHYYVAMKINKPQFVKGIGTMEVNACREHIAKIEAPGAIKRFGRGLELRSDWDDVRLGVMEYGIRQKFTTHDDLREMLLATGDQKLIEGNYWHDNFFGSCTCDKCDNKGLNHLGKILMKVRDEIRNKN
jgi:ribA/ribD-fused uncharacterized protein